MKQLPALDSADPLWPRKFGDSLWAEFQISPRHITELAWRLGSSRITQFVRPIIRFLSPSYFPADDDCLGSICEFRRRSDVAEEIFTFRHSCLRRGIWHYLGVSLSDRRLLKLFDRVAFTSATQSTGADIAIYGICHPESQLKGHS